MTITAVAGWYETLVTAPLGRQEVNAPNTLAAVPFNVLQRQNQRSKNAGNSSGVWTPDGSEAVQ